MCVANSRHEEKSLSNFTAVAATAITTLTIALNEACCVYMQSVVGSYRQGLKLCLTNLPTIKSPGETRERERELDPNISIYRNYFGAYVDYTLHLFQHVVKPSVLMTCVR